MAEAEGFDRTSRGKGVNCCIESELREKPESSQRVLAFLTEARSGHVGKQYNYTKDQWCYLRNGNMYVLQRTSKKSVTGDSHLHQKYPHENKATTNKYTYHEQETLRKKHGGGSQFLRSGINLANSSTMLMSVSMQQDWA